MGEWRNKVDIDATVACRAATQARLKAPDAVEWKGEKGGWDPQKDWYYNVDLEANAMNSFGAKLRSVFYCQALCSDKELPNGLHRVAVSVREQLDRTFTRARLTRLCYEIVKHDCSIDSTRRVRA